MQIFNYKQPTTQVYPFKSQTVLTNRTIQDFRILASDIFTNIIIDQIRTQHNYIYISILAKTADSELYIKKYFQCREQNKVIKANLLYSSLPQNTILDCYIIINSLPDYVAYQSQQIQLQRSVISYTNQAKPITNLDFQGLISIQPAPANFIPKNKVTNEDYIVYRNINPGYQLSAPQMANFQHKLIKKLNMISVPASQTLLLDLKDINYQLSKQTESNIITLYLDTNIKELGCDY